MGEEYVRSIGKDFKALIPKFYTPIYKKYIREEVKLLTKNCAGAERVLEAGVGIGRLIPIVSPLAREFFGVDNANLMVEKSKEVAKKFSNVKIIKGGLEELSKVFPKNYFDYTLCVWNTLGNVKDEVKVLKQFGKITSKSIFITVFRKGTLMDRMNFYKAVGMKIKKIDKKNEIFYFATGFWSKAYSLEEIERLSRQSGLKVKHGKVLNNVMLWVELVSDEN